MKKIIAITSILLSTMGCAFAVTAQSGVYVNANGGYSFPTTFSDSSMTSAFGVNTTQSNRGLTGGLLIGYDYALAPNYLMGIEGGYTWFGKTDYNFANVGTLTSKQQGIQALLTGTYLNQNGFNLSGKAGAVYMTQSAYLSGIPGNSPESSVHAWEPALAAAMGYMIGQNCNISLQYEHIFGSDTTSAVQDITKPQSQNTVTIGLTYKFSGLNKI